jgi:integrase/recombinase XerD
VHQFLKLIKDNHVSKFDSARIQSYLLYCMKELKHSENQIHSRINALKFYYEQVLKQEKLFIDIPRPKKVKQLPKVIDIHDVKKMIQCTENIKHKLILQLVYGMGLRVSEIVAMKITDIDSKRMQVHIQSGKGKKDRMGNLPETLLEPLRTYYKAYMPKKYLFEGALGEQYSIRSAQAVFKDAMKRAHINKVVGIHGLRHSYATHLHEAGTDITLIQELLGHNQLSTTMGYTHVSKRNIEKVKSPLDSFDSL